ncbi:hypothetical protein R1sor_012968 [Riccia sorocarpa]|uniref:Reverse transcriptase zinc-binding domain-containing protein n=1 Tax=Riccia sorocarpa TaxID=122646 RepID=A0ABD3I9B0_9MARC
MVLNRTVAFNVGPKHIICLRKSSSHRYCGVAGLKRPVGERAGGSGSVIKTARHEEGHGRGQNFKAEGDSTKEKHGGIGGYTISRFFRKIRESKGNKMARRQVSEDELVQALKRVALKNTTDVNELAVQVTVSKKDSLKGIKNLAEKGVLSFYFEGEPVISSFRSWAQIHWGRKLNAQIDSIQEFGDKRILTVLVTADAREEVLKQSHQSIKGCLVAHFPWSPDMETPEYNPVLKPIQVEVERIPKRVKEDLIKILSRLGQVLHIPPDSRDLVYKGVTATILRDENEPLPDVLIVNALGCQFRCPVREVKKEIPEDEESGTGLGGAAGKADEGNDAVQSAIRNRNDRRASASNNVSNHDQFGYETAAADEEVIGRQLDINAVPSVQVHEDLTEIVVHTRGEGVLNEGERSRHNRTNLSEGEVVPETQFSTPRDTQGKLWTRRKDVQPKAKKKLGTRKTMTEGEGRKDRDNATVKKRRMQIPLRALRLSDAREQALKREGPRFSRCQTRDGRFTWSRIDRIYSSSLLPKKVAHHIHLWTSDHLPISAWFELGEEEPEGKQIHTSAYFKVDPYVLKENLEHLKQGYPGAELNVGGHTFTGGDLGLSEYASIWKVTRLGWFWEGVGVFTLACYRGAVYTGISRVLEDGKAAPSIEGRNLVPSPEGGSPRDDTAIFTEVDMASSQTLFQTLAILEKASEAKVNMSKSKILLIGKYTPFPEWVESLGLSLVDPLQPPVYLGALALTERRGVDDSKRVVEKHFQKALMCRVMLRALADPIISLWAPLLADRIFGASADQLGSVICLRQSPGSSRLGPVTVVLLKAWSEFISDFRWSPTDPGQISGADVRRGCFMITRQWADVKEAAVTSAGVTAWASSVGLNSIDDIKLRPVAVRQRINGSVSELERRVLGWILDGVFRGGYAICTLAEWRNKNGGRELNLTWRGGQVYAIIRADCIGKQASVMNDRLQLRWDTQVWNSIWRGMNSKGLCQRHRIFLWRITTNAFLTGEREKRMGFDSFACLFCGGGTEDTTHALVTCPRWNQFWMVVATRVPGWSIIREMVLALVSLVEMLRWATEAEGQDRYFPFGFW